jgi:hypothetical protein
MKLNKLKFENFNDKEDSMDPNINVSKNIISILKAKVVAFNGGNKKRININQLKKIYRTASKNKPSNLDKSYHDYAIAKVNAFLAVSGNKRKFNLELSSKKKSCGSFSIESSIEPIEEDYEINEMNISYSNPEDLYLADENDVITFNY